MRSFKMFKIPAWLAFILQVFALGFVLQLLVDNLGSWGAWGFVFFILLYCCYMLIKKRDNYMAVMRTVETKIWGQPLDKVYGKPPKVKIVLGNKK